MSGEKKCWNFNGGVWELIWEPLLNNQNQKGELWESIELIVLPGEQPYYLSYQTKENCVKYYSRTQGDSNNIIRSQWQKKLWYFLNILMISTWLLTISKIINNPPPLCCYLLYLQATSRHMRDINKKTILTILSVPTFILEMSVMDQ